MKKIFTVITIGILCLSMFSMLAPKGIADGSVNSNTPLDNYTPVVPEEKLGSAEVLVIEDIIPWYTGYWPCDTDAVPAALNTLGKTYDLIHSDHLATTDLTQYKIVILASTQDRSTYVNIDANIAKINAFVSGGGVYVCHACDYGWGYPGAWSDWSGLQIMPGGVTHVTGYCTMYIHITNPLSPIVASLNDAYFAGWGYSAHGYFTNVPAGADTVMVTYSDLPTYIVYSYGSGKVLATMQTVEWGWGGVYGWVGGFRKEFLLNEIKYAQEFIQVPFALEVSPAYSTVNVDEVVTFTGSVLDQHGNGIPDILVGVDDPVREICTTTKTNVNGYFTYSVSANRAAEFRLTFYVASLSKECTIRVQRLEASWANQTLTVHNTELDSYNVTLYVNNQYIGNWIILPSQSKELWRATNPITSNLIKVVTSNLRTGKVYTITANSLSEYNSTYIPGIYDIPLSPKLSQYNILTTDSCQSQTYTNVFQTSQTAASTPPVTSSGSSQKGPVKVDVGISHGPALGLTPEVSAGCSVFTGFKAECSAGCGIAGGLEFGFKLGLAFPIQPFHEHGCGWGCKIVFAEAECSAGASISAQAGYQVGAGVGVGVKSPANIVIFDPEGRQVGYTPNLDYATLIRYIPGATYSGPFTEPQAISIPNPLPGYYNIQLIGTATGTFELTVERIIAGQVTYSESITSTIAMGIVYEYTASTTDKLSLKPNPIGTLKHLKDYINSLPQTVFKQKPDQMKKALSNKIDEVILKVEVGNYTDAINKLLYDIRAKMDGDSTAEDWIINPAIQRTLCLAIDHIISDVKEISKP